MVKQTNKKIVIFDFCQTLCDFETADPYLDFLFQNCQSIKKGFKAKLLSFLLKSSILGLFSDVLWHFCHLSLKKRVLLSRLKGAKKKEIIELSLIFYQQSIRPHLINETISLLQAYQSKDYHIAIVSASFYDFLRFFAEEYNVDLLVANKILYNGEDRCLGKMEYPDCIYKNKVSRFKKASGLDSFDMIDYSYGDSKSDIPILSIAKTGVVISYMNHKSWVDKTNLKEIIWQ